MLTATSHGFLLQRFEPLISLEPKVGDPQACGIVAHNALDILRETFSGFGVDVERQCQLGAANSIQLAQDGLGDVADLPARHIIENEDRIVSIDTPLRRHRDRGSAHQGFRLSGHRVGV